MRIENNDSIFQCERYHYYPKQEPKKVREFFISLAVLPIVWAFILWGFSFF